MIKSILEEDYSYVFAVMKEEFADLHQLTQPGNLFRGQV